MAAKPVQLIVGCFLHMHFLNYYFLLHIITDFVYQTCYYQKIKIEMFFQAPPEIPSKQHHCWMHLIYVSKIGYHFTVLVKIIINEGKSLKLKCFGMPLAQNPPQTSAISTPMWLRAMYCKSYIIT